jgi:RNA methyltransferase, TrmH family
MLAKNTISFVSSLQQKKFRNLHQLFVAEGEKIVNEILTYFPHLLANVYATESWIQNNTIFFNRFYNQITQISGKDLERISSLHSPNEVLATLNLPAQTDLPDAQSLQNGLHLALYNLQDPGNVGTIIRLADWFGIKNIFCSAETVDIYNSKVVQATMGSLFRVNVFYTDIQKLIQNTSLNPCATSANGQNMWELNPQELKKKGALLIIGNESAGLPDDIQKLCQHHIAIPKIGKAESLNAAVATGILASFFNKI